jgi:hypothetical protein
LPPAGLLCPVSGKRPVDRRDGHYSNHFIAHTSPFLRISSLVAHPLIGPTLVLPSRPVVLLALTSIRPFPRTPPDTGIDICTPCTTRLPLKGSARRRQSKKSHRKVSAGGRLRIGQLSTGSTGSTRAILPLQGALDHHLHLHRRLHRHRVSYRCWHAPLIRQAKRHETRRVSKTATPRSSGIACVHDQSNGQTEDIDRPKGDTWAYQSYRGR